MQKQSRYSNSQLHGLLLLMMSCYYNIVPLLGAQNASSTGLIEVDVGLILDLDDILGKMSHTCISMALEDFYASNLQTRTTKIVLHTRDSKNDVVEAASAAIDLMRNVQVQAILGLQSCNQADFVIDIGNKTQVPIISSASSPSLSPKDNPYFIRGAQNGSSQVQSLADIVKAFSWREVVLIYENTEYGRGIGPYLADSLLGVGSQVRYRSIMSLSATDDNIQKELYKLMTMQTRVFVVHMLPSLASRFFLKAKQVGMMNKGYAWIITDGLTSRLDSVDPKVIGLMQGVIGVKPYVPNSSELQNFTERWRKRFRRENPDVDRFELNVLGLWAYDSAMMLAMAVEISGVAQSKFKKPVSTSNLVDLAAIGSSEMGPRLLQSIKNTRFQGLSGEFDLVDGQLQPLAFQIVNVIGKGEREIGFWTRESGISKELILASNRNYTTNKEDLGAIVWPGESNLVPKGWEIPTGERKLRVGVPAKSGFAEFVKVKMDSETNAVIATGFCIDVFKEVVDHSLPYAVPYEFVSFESDRSGSYDDLVNQLFLGNYDAVVGDVTILANRSRFADFTLPFTESSVAMIVRIQDDERKNAWIFMKPLKMDLWLTTGAFFIFTGFVVWVLEHRVNEEFRGPPHKQVGMIFWFSFSTLVFAQKEKVISNLSRFVVIVWVFVVLVLTSSYTASLTSMLTVQKLQPSVTDIMDLKKNEEYVGYQTGSFVDGLLKRETFNPSKLRNYSTFEDYDEALSTRSVAAIIDEVPYIRLFLANPKYCTKYTMVGPICKTAGFGFAFPKGSPLVPDVSRAILNVTEGGKLTQIQHQWFGEEAKCAEQDGAKVTSGSLDIESFKGLFLVAATSSSFALILFLSIFLYDNRVILASNNSSLWQKLIAMAKNFDKEKEKTSDASKKTKLANEGMAVAADCPQSPTTNSSRLAEWIYIPDEGFASTETNTPIHETIEIVETSEER
ncbi:glutamate receptor 2.8-like isoform X1 [Rhododendron vialii]|uniref:glutamate receptor 2.8-like isoform X1 n=2 Tax=Rhododendron vialii TaxID=182163 RepID=UPI00265D66F0|nr:glutamate receptor 2.8-like isoform X1 [Rhododendron vialii]